MINWENKPKTTTPLSANNLNQMQTDLLEATHTYYLPITSTIKSNTNITIPCKYKVGANVLDVYLDGHLLTKTTSNKEGNYKEVGETDTISNKIQLDGTSGSWQVEAGEEFYFVVRGEYNE